ncbi:MAG: hypothetical protein HY323_03625 [Betaproteobacteria bacterium]|nr:hypothetical protein [Betaproteobacteria bacterium]MBI3936042.1 hypothetical protein [Betaproteobacteria bacterium]
MDQCYSRVGILELEEISRGSALGRSVQGIGRRLASLLDLPAHESLVLLLLR